MIAPPGSSEAYFEFVVSMNEVFAGISGSFSAVVDISVRETYFKVCFRHIHLRFRVSRINISTSQVPTPGPPRREREGRTRF